MDELDEKLLLGTRDCMFKAIMLDPNNEDYLKGIIECVTNIPMKELDNIQIKNAEYVIENKNDKRMHSDIIVSVGRKYINIEMNKYYYNGLFNKNNAYFHSLYSTLYNTNEDYIEVGETIQINFNDFYYFQNKQEIYKFVTKEETTNERLDDGEVKYHINLAFIKDTCYNKPVNKLSKFERYCLLLMAETKKFADKISGDDRIMKKVSERLENLSKDEKMIGLYDAELEAEKVRKTQLRGAKEEGRKEEKIEIVKNMLNKNINMNLISEVTGLSLEEIEILKAN